MTEYQNDQLITLLWDSMKKDPEHKDRRQTGWGTKTKEGLCACVARICAGPAAEPDGLNAEQRESLRDRARAQYGSDDIEIDDQAEVSVGADGAWVQGWVLVEGEEA